MLSIESALLTLEDVKNKRFRTVRMQLGYEMTEIDMFLNQIEDTLRHYESGGGPKAADDDDASENTESTEPAESEEEIRLKAELEEARMRAAELEGDLSRTQDELEQARQETRQALQSAAHAPTDDTENNNPFSALTEDSSAGGNSAESSDEEKNDSMFDSLIEEHEERKLRRSSLPDIDDDSTSSDRTTAAEDEALREKLVKELEAVKEEMLYFKNAHAEISKELQRRTETENNSGSPKSASRMLELAERTASQLISEAEAERDRLLSGVKEGTEEELQEMRRERAYLIEVNKDLRDRETTSRQRLREFFSANLTALDKDPLVEAIPESYTRHQSDDKNPIRTGSEDSSNSVEGNAHTNIEDSDNKAPSSEFMEALKEVEGQPNPYAHMLLDEDGNALQLPENAEDDEEYDEIDRLINSEIEAFSSSLSDDS